MMRGICGVMMGLVVGCGTSKDDPSDTATDGSMTTTVSTTTTAGTTGCLTFKRWTRSNSASSLKSWG